MTNVTEICSQPRLIEMRWLTDTKGTGIDVTSIPLPHDKSLKTSYDPREITAGSKAEIIIHTQDVPDGSAAEVTIFDSCNRQVVCGGHLLNLCVDNNIVIDPQRHDATGRRYPVWRFAENLPVWKIWDCSRYFFRVKVFPLGFSQLISHPLTEDEPEALELWKWKRKMADCFAQRQVEFSPWPGNKSNPGVRLDRRTEMHEIQIRWPECAHSRSVWHTHVFARANRKAEIGQEDDPCHCEGRQAFGKTVPKTAGAFVAGESYHLPWEPGIWGRLIQDSFIYHHTGNGTARCRHPHKLPYTIDFKTGEVTSNCEHPATAENAESLLLLGLTGAENQSPATENLSNTMTVIRERGMDGFKAFSQIDGEAAEIGIPLRGALTVTADTVKSNSAIPSVPRFLVFLNASLSGLDARLAQAFIDRGTQNVIAFRGLISGLMADKLACEFYRNWAESDFDPLQIPEVFKATFDEQSLPMKPVLYGFGACAVAPHLEKASIRRETPDGRTRSEQA